MATAQHASQSFARLADEIGTVSARRGSVTMSPTSDYREVSDVVELREVCGKQVLVRPRGHAYGYVRAIIDYSEDARQWSVAYIDNTKRVRRVVLYQSTAELFKSLQIMSNLLV